MFAKEAIMADLLDRLATHPDNPIVTEDLNKIASLDYLPMILVVEGPDEVKDIGMSHGETIETRQGIISVVSFVQADTDELGPSTMRYFQANLRKVVYENQRRRIGDNAGIREIRQSQLAPAPSENSVFAQQITFRVDYKENISKLFDAVIPTT